MENLSYASNVYGKSVCELEEIFGVIDGGDMGVTIDFCHAEATGQTFQLLEKYKDIRCDVHMSNRAHKPFMEEPPSLVAFLAKLREHQYSGHLTMELNRTYTTQEILKNKAVLEKILNM